MSYLFHVFLNFLAVTAFLMFFCVDLELQLQFFRGRNCDEASSWCLLSLIRAPLSLAERGTGGRSCCLLELSMARCHEDSSSCRRNCIWSFLVSPYDFCPVVFPSAKSLLVGLPTLFMVFIPTQNPSLVLQPHLFHPFLMMLVCFLLSQFTFTHGGLTLLCLPLSQLLSWQICLPPPLLWTRFPHCILVSHQQFYFFVCVITL